MRKFFKPRLTLILFIVLVVFMLAMAVWWYVFMGTMVDEKIELAQKLNATPDLIESIRQEESKRQIMIGSEGLTFLLILLGGLWLIYRSYVKIRELNIQQENFVLSVTHELKTPIASLMVFLDGLESDRIPVEKKELILPKMRHDLRRLHRTVENLLETGRLTRIDRFMQKSEFDFRQLIEERIEQLEHVQTQAPVKINTNLDDPVWLNGDRAAVARAVDAILENGLKYNQSDPIEITVDLVNTQRSVQLTISDNGIGIEKSNQRRVFDRFARVGNEMTRQFEGSGLGLYLCRKIVRAHGGTIKVVSEGKDKGAAFTMEFDRVIRG